MEYCLPLRVYVPSDAVETPISTVSTRPSRAGHWKRPYDCVEKSPVTVLPAVSVFAGPP